MKFLLPVFAILILAGQTRAQEIEIKKGTVLTYLISTNAGDEYNFIVTVKKYGPDGIDFDWKMTNEQSSAGKVTLTANALSDAVKYINYFRNGSSLTLKEESAVWLSGDNYGDLEEKSITQMDMGSGKKIYHAEDSDFEIQVKGKSIQVITLHAKDESGELAVAVLKNGKNPLIIAMDMEQFQLELVSVD
jgi:hypothetical protein